MSIIYKSSLRVIVHAMFVYRSHLFGLSGLVSFISGKCRICPIDIHTSWGYIHVPHDFLVKNTQHFKQIGVCLFPITFPTMNGF